MSQHLKGLLITFIGVLVISPDVLLVRLIEADTLTKLFWRGLLSGLVILAAFSLMGHRLRFGRKDWLLAVVFALGTYCFLYAVEHTQAANVLLISATAPVIAAIIAIVVLKERVSGLTWVGIIGALIGVGIIAAGSARGAGGALIGDLAAFGGAASLAVTFSIARANSEVSMVPAMGLSGLVIAATAGLMAPTLAVTGGDWIWVGLLGGICVPLGFGLLTTGPQYLPAEEVSLILLLEALLGPLLVWLVLGEFPGQAALLGGFVILSVLAATNAMRLRR